MSDLKNDKLFFPPVSSAKSAVPISGTSERSQQNLPAQLLCDALIICVKKRRASVVVLQRNLGVGYEDALTLLDEMVKKGWITKPNGEESYHLLNLAFDTFNDLEEQETTLEKAAKKEDPKYKQAIRIVIEMGRASTSVLQRRLNIGYGQAAYFMDLMHEEGIIGPEEGSKPRTVLVGDDYLKNKGF